MKRIKIFNKFYNCESGDQYLDSMEEFEPATVALFQKLIKPSDAVVDIGANIGLTALMFSQMARTVACFEPIKRSMDYLMQNIVVNEVYNVTPYHIALSNSEGQRKFMLASSNRTGAHISKGEIVPGHDEEIVVSKTLDSVSKTLEQINKIDVIKIDVEGHEKYVLEGARETLERDKPIVVLELNVWCLDVLQGITMPDYIGYLNTVFPYVYAVSNDGKTVHSLKEAIEAYHVMHQHLFKGEFNTIVAGFDETLIQKLV